MRRTIQVKQQFLASITLFWKWQSIETANVRYRKVEHIKSEGLQTGKIHIISIL